MSRIVLFVDDDRALRTMVERHAQRYEASFRLLTCRDGTEAVEVLQNQPVALVVLDLVMPEMDGYEVLAFLSEKFPHLPVIIQTAYADDKLSKVALVKGVAEILTKPVDLDRLFGGIEALLERSDRVASLQSVSVDFFWGLIEMDRKDCTLHVYNRSSKEKGTLYFRSGQMIGACLEELRDVDAAREIVSWEAAFFYFVNGCPDMEGASPVHRDEL